MVGALGVASWGRSGSQRVAAGRSIGSRLMVAPLAPLGQRAARRGPGALAVAGGRRLPATSDGAVCALRLHKTAAILSSFLWLHSSARLCTPGQYVSQADVIGIRICGAGSAAALVEAPSQMQALAAKTGSSCSVR